MTANGIAPYPLRVEQKALDDLRRRLEGARWPREIAEAGWDYGTDQAFLRKVVERWVDGYDWRKTEAEINSWNSFVTTAAGQRIHLLHSRADESDAIPLVLIHGWPGSIVEFLDAAPLLREKFHLVILSLPGYGFSGPTSERGVDVAKIAAAVDEVMAQLGYVRYLAQGGDWGALVVRYLGEHYPQTAVAVHTNLLFAPPDGSDTDAMVGVTEQEITWLADAMQRMSDGSAYMEINRTRPHSVGYGLDDSPLGLAGYILEKFDAWCDTRDGMPISTDRLIDNLMLYWLTATGTSAARLYCESSRAGTFAIDPWDGRVDVPVGYSAYRYEVVPTPRAWAEKRYNLVYYASHDKGGHFAAFEQPQIFSDDLNAYADRLRELDIF